MTPKVRKRATGAVVHPRLQKSQSPGPALPWRRRSAPATLDKYLANPRAMVPDTSIIYAGLKNAAERADLIAYLETLH
jgi:cytochrome c2